MFEQTLKLGREMGHFSRPPTGFVRKLPILSETPYLNMFWLNDRISCFFDTHWRKQQLGNSFPFWKFFLEIFFFLVVLFRSRLSPPFFHFFPGRTNTQTADTHPNERERGEKDKNTRKVLRDGYHRRKPGPYNARRRCRGKKILVKSSLRCVVFVETLSCFSPLSLECDG